MSLFQSISLWDEYKILNTVYAQRERRIDLLWFICDTQVVWESMKSS